MGRRRRRSVEHRERRPRSGAGGRRRTENLRRGNLNSTPGCAAPRVSAGSIRTTSPSFAWGYAGARCWNDRILGFRTTPSRISIARRMVGSASHAAGPAMHGRQVRQQRLADLPGRRVPQVRGTVVDGVVVHAVADRDIGSVNDVGRAQLKPMPTSQETSTMRLPGVKAASSSLGDEDQGCVGVLQDAVDDDVVLGEEVGHREPRPGLSSASVRSGASGSGPSGRSAWVDRRRDRGDVSVGQDVHIVDAVRVQRGDGAAGGRAEPDDGGAQPAAVAAGDPGQLQRVQDGAVAGQLVVLVEDVQAEVPAVGSSGSSPRTRSASAAGRSRPGSARSSCTQCGQPQTTCPAGSSREILGAAAWAAR